jgi:transposase
MTDRLLTAREVAGTLTVSTETVLRWTRLGKFEGVAIRLPSGQLRYRETRLDERIEEWAATERGSATHPAGRRPTGNVALATHPTNEEVS